MESHGEAYREVSDSISTETLTEETIIKIESLSNEPTFDEPDHVDPTSSTSMNGPKKGTEISESQLQLKTSLHRRDSPTSTISKQKKFHASIASSTYSKLSQRMQLPHVLGTLPGYLRKAKTNEKAKPQTAPASTLKKVASPSSVVAQIGDSIIEQTSHKQTKGINELLREVQHERNDDLKLKLLKKSTVMMMEHDKLKSLQTLEVQAATLKKINMELQVALATKDDSINSFTFEVERFQHELSLKSKLIEMMLAEKKCVEQELKASTLNCEKSSERERELVQKIRDVQVQLQARDGEIGTLRQISNSLVDENKSLKAQSLDGTQTNRKAIVFSIENLKRELFHLKNNEEKFKQQILTLDSKLDDERHKNYRTENLLQLRGEYIKTLQDTDEVHKARHVIQVKEVEVFRKKLIEIKKTKNKMNEELTNLHSIMNSQEHEIHRMKNELLMKDAKLMMRYYRVGSSAEEEADIS